jgi:hypothetical protein
MAQRLYDHLLMAYLPDGLSEGTHGVMSQESCRELC